MSKIYRFFNSRLLGIGLVSECTVVCDKLVFKESYYGTK